MTPYGYAGRGSNGSQAAASPAVPTGEAAAASPVAALRVYVEPVVGEHSRGATHCYDHSNQSCVKGQVRLNASSATDWAFEPQANESPYELTISAVNGSDYARSRICSPPDW